jgi:hypothetical protein
VDFSRWLKRSGAVALVMVVVGPAASGPRPARAQPAGEAAATIDELRRTVEELQRTVEARDAVIDDLLRRMGEMERRVSVAAPDQAPPAAQSAPEPTAPAIPEPPLPAAEAEAAEVAEEAAPPPAPGRVEVDEEAVATALERALVLEEALLLPAGTVQVQPSFTFIRQETDTPTVFLGGGGERVAADEVRSDSLLAGLTLRLGLPFDSQLTLDVPYLYEGTSTVTRVDSAGVREESRDIRGFGDIGVAVSKGLLRERGWRPDLIASVRWDTDTGQSDAGVPLGSGFDEVTASLTAVKSQDPLVFVGGLSYTHTFAEDDVELGGVVGVSFGTVLAASPETSLRFFIDQSFVGEDEVDGVAVPGSDETVGLFTVGASTILTSRVFLDVELGIGLTESAPDYTINVALPIRFDLPFRF